MPPSSARLPLSQLLAYGVPATGYSVYLFFIQFYFLNYATDVLLLAPGAIGLLFGVGRLWDAVSDPLAGYWSDRTRSRIGRRRPWMFAALPLLAGTFVMVWSPPASMQGTTLVLWTGVALFGFYTAFTVYTVPFVALGAELTSDHHERSRVFGVSRAGFTLGMMLSFVLIDHVSTAADPRATAGGVSVVAAVLLTALLLVPPAVLRERQARGRGGRHPFAAFGDVLRNPHARLLLLVWFVDSLGGGVLGVLAPYVTKYIAKRPDLIAVMPAFFFVSSIVSIPLWIKLSRRYGKRDVWIAGMIGVALCFGGGFFVPQGEIVPFCVLMALAGAFFATGGPIAYSILADVIDYDEYATGERKEGAYSAAFSFVLKLAIGLMILVTGLVLELSGFTPNVDQTPGALLALRALFCGVPFAAFLVGAFAFRRFALDEREHGRISDELARRGVKE